MKVFSWDQVLVVYRENQQEIDALCDEKNITLQAVGAFCNYQGLWDAGHFDGSYVGGPYALEYDAHSALIALWYETTPMPVEIIDFIDECKALKDMLRKHSVYQYGGQYFIFYHY